MKQISEICEDFIAQYSLLNGEYSDATDPFLTLADGESHGREAVMQKYITRTGIPKLSLPMIPQYRFMWQDDKLPILYTNLTTGGTMTLYTMLPISMTQADCIALAEKMGVNRIHWVLIDYLDYESVKKQAISPKESIEEVVEPQKVWEQFANMGYTAPL